MLDLEQCKVDGEGEVCCPRCEAPHRGVVMYSSPPTYDCGECGLRFRGERYNERPRPLDSTLAQGYTHGHGEQHAAGNN